MKTKLLFMSVLAAVVSLALTSCGDDEGDSNTNQAPRSFSVAVTNITTDGASLNWTEAIDPDGDAVIYSVELDENTVASSLTTTTMNLTGLTEDTSYSGQVTATDGNGGSTTASFSFTTSGPSNQTPGSFSVSVDDIMQTSASLSWTAASDPDGDNITYSIILEGNTLVSSQSSTAYALSSLSAETSYSGVIVASDGNGGTSSAVYSFTTLEESHVFDPSLFTSASIVGSVTLVDCQLEDGSTTDCYQITFISNPVADGPYCPETTSSDEFGLGIYDGDTEPRPGKNNPQFSPMSSTMFDAIENDGYDIVDASGNVRIQDPGAGGSPGNPSFSYCLDAGADDDLQLTFLIPAIPQMANSNNIIESVEPMGVSLDGVPINGVPPSATAGIGGGSSTNAKIPALDPCGGHQDPAGYYHWHFIAEAMNEVLSASGISEVSCTNITQSKTALNGYAKDGYPIYSSAEADGSTPSDLDECNGHTSPTSEYPDGIYHYHASTSLAPNIPPCLKGKAVTSLFSVN